MPIDIRSNAARYYDLNPEMLDDIGFYQDRVPFPEATILELGCGTGRVLIPMSKNCGYIQGIDISAAMISICQSKLKSEAVPGIRARVVVGDITNLDLDITFDLIIAPFRVFQNLETNSETDGFFRSVRKHLAPSGTCLLNVFKPNRDPEALRRKWEEKKEYPCWETPVEGGLVTCHGRNTRMNPEKMVLYPELIYCTYSGSDLIEEIVLKIVMRCYYPDEFKKTILNQGFEILNCWGGYSGEPYGEGPELIVEFRNPS